MLFTPKLLHRDDSGTVHGLNKALPWAQKLWGIPRQHCSFRRIFLKGRDRAALKAALLKAQREALQPDGQFLIYRDPGQETASEWAIHTPIETGVRILPEPLIHQRPAGDAIRLVKAMTGFEGQIWQGDILMGSRWWKAKPTLPQWVNFHRAFNADAASIEGVPTAITPALRSDLPPFQFSREQFDRILRPANVAIMLTSLVAVVGLFLAGSHVQYLLNIKQSESDIASLRGETRKILSQRRQALANMETTLSLQDIGINTLFLQSLAEISEIFESTDYRLERAGLSDGRLQLRLIGDDRLEISEIVSQLESIPSIEKVSINLSGNNAILLESYLTVTASGNDEETAP